MLENLIPISKEHSINRVVATVYLPQKVLKPKDLFEKIKSDNKFKNYPKKTIINSRTINIQDSGLGITDGEIKGFVFENYTESGSIDNILKLENKDNNAILSIEKRSYSNWENFKKIIEDNFNEFGEVLDFYISAVSLSYRDEFIWESNDSIKIDEVFNEGSELLNKKFLNSKNGSLILFTQSGKNNNTEEKTEISFSNDLKRIVIVHLHAYKISDYESYSNMTNGRNFSDLFEEGHKANRSILENILTKETQIKIGLTKK